MVTIEQAIDDLKNNIIFNGNACTTEAELIIILESYKSTIDKLKNDKSELIKFLINHQSECPLPDGMRYKTFGCTKSFPNSHCETCILHNIDFINIKEEL